MAFPTTSLAPDEPTNTEKMRKLPWAIFANAANAAFGQFTVFGAVFVLFLNALGLSKTSIGFLFSLFPFFGLTALFTAPVVARFGYKRTYQTFWALRKLVAAGLLLTPWVLAAFGGQAAAWYVGACVAVFAMFRAVGETGYYPWAQEFIPAGVRGKFTATENMLVTLTSLAAVGVAGYVIAHTEGLTGFMALIAVGVVFGLISVWGSGHLPGGAPVPREQAQQAGPGRLLGPLRDRDFRLYLFGASLVTLAWNPVGSFLPLFMQEQAGLTASQVVWLEMGGLTAGLMAAYVWGWAADRYGSKPVMLTGLFLISLAPILWLIMPRFTALSAYAALAIAFLRGLVGLGWSIGSTRLLFVNLVPPDQKSAYMAVNYAWMGAVGGVSQALGGRLLDLTAGVSGKLLFITLDPYTVLFVAGIGLPILAGLLLRRIRTDSRFSMTEFAGLFLQGNPLLAAGSLIRYGRARDEQAAVSVTERLGQARSRLTVEELLEALADPRFNVRFEAVLALARMPADARVIEALAGILAGEEPALSVVAAWALGRLGDERGVPALRAALTASPYRSVQAHSARALGTLEDAGSTAQLLERFEHESDHGLRMAYAAALGKLGEARAVKPLLAFVGTRRDPSARKELALTLARLLGDEQHFIHLWRRMQGEAGTALAQALLDLRRRLEKAAGPNGAGPVHDDRPDAGSLAAAAADAFAHYDLAAGAAGLRALIEALPAEDFEPATRAVLSECAARLAEFGAERQEYLLLAVHALHAGPAAATPHAVPADNSKAGESRGISGLDGDIQGGNRE